MASAASLAFMMIGAPGVRAEIVTVQGADGAAGADGANPGDSGLPGGDGESVAANAGSAQPVTAPQNQGTATGGNGGAGGSGVGAGGGDGGNGGAATASAATTIISGSAEADANSFGGDGGAGGNAGTLPFPANGGAGGDATAMSAATDADDGPVDSSAIAKGERGASVIARPEPAAVRRRAATPHPGAPGTLCRPQAQSAA